MIKGGFGASGTNGTRARFSRDKPACWERFTQKVPSGPRIKLVEHYKTKGIPLNPAPPLLKFLLADEIPLRSAADWKTFDAELDALISKDPRAEYSSSHYRLVEVPDQMMVQASLIQNAWRDVRCIKL